MAGLGLGVLLVVSGAASCSKDSSDGGAARRAATSTTTTKSTTTTAATSTTATSTTSTTPGPTTSTAGGPTTTAPGASTTETVPGSPGGGAPGGGGPTTTVAGGGRTPPPTKPDPNAPPPKEYQGPFDDQSPGTNISFQRGAEVSSVEIKGLEVTCEPKDNTGESRTDTIDLRFPEVPVRGDSSVDLTLVDSPYKPSLSGSFGADGTFSGSVFLTYDKDGYACGGEYPFIAKPS